MNSQIQALAKLVDRAEFFQRRSRAWHACASRWRSRSIDRMNGQNAAERLAGAAIARAESAIARASAAERELAELRVELERERKLSSELAERSAPKGAGK